MVLALNEMKSGPLDVSLELIAVCGQVWIQVMTEIGHSFLDGFGMLPMANSVCWYGYVLRRGWSCL